MSLTTYALTITAHDETGAPVADALVTAQLVDLKGRARADFPSDGVVMPTTVVGLTNASGVATIDLWPNTAGAKDTRYQVKVRRPSGTDFLVNERVQMPASASSLQTLVAATAITIASLVAGPGVSIAGSTIGADITSLSAAAEVDDAADYLMLWDDSASAYRKVLPSLVGGAGAFGALSDVTLTAPADGHFPRYNGAAWVNAALVAADIPALATSKITSGTFEDALVAESNVTQHQAALSLTTSQITGINLYATTAALAALDSSTSDAFASLGTAAALNVGTGANNVVQLDGSSLLPAVDGSQLTNLPTSDLSAVAEHVLPDGTNTRNLGSASFEWAALYTNSAYLNAPTVNQELVAVSRYIGVWKVDGYPRLAISTSGTSVAIGAYLGWSNSAINQTTVDTRLYRDAAGIIAQRNGTAAQSHRWYNTYTDASNNEYLEAVFETDIAYLRTVKNGTGTQRNIVLEGANRASKISDPAGGATTDAEARTAINAILDTLESHGLSAAA